MIDFMSQLRVYVKFNISTRHGLHCHQNKEGVTVSAAKELIFFLAAGTVRSFDRSLMFQLLLSKVKDSLASHTLPCAQEFEGGHSQDR